MKDDCLFCQISRDPDKVVWQNDSFAAFKDIHPKSRIHLLLVPKEHVDTLDEVQPEMGTKLVAAIQELAKSQDIQGRYRISVNVGRAGGQEIDHVHVHVQAE